MACSAEPNGLAEDYESKAFAGFQRTQPDDAVDTVTGELLGLTRAAATRFFPEPEFGDQLEPLALLEPLGQ